MRLFKCFSFQITNWLIKLPFWLIGVLICSSYAQDELPSADSSRIIISGNLVKIGTLQLDRQKREISIPGNICLTKGPLEYFAVAKDGKTYESVVELDVNPTHLQTALLLMGLEYGQNLAFQGDTTLPRGDLVEVFISWQQGQKKVQKRAEDLMWDDAHQKKMPHTKWVFTGSTFIEGRFAAQFEKSLIAVFSDPVAILNNPLLGRIDDTVYTVNEKLVPEHGTPVNIIIKIPSKGKV